MRHQIPFIVEKQRERKIKIIRLDMDGEYYGWHTEKGKMLGPFVIFLAEQAIVVQYTATKMV